MTTKQEHRRKQAAENKRLRAAVGAIHDLLHRGDVDGAHKACECAMDGDTVSQPSISAGETANLHAFAAEFNQLCNKHRCASAAVTLIPIGANKASVQLCGNVDVCKVVEQAFGAHSTYMGEHGGANV